MRHVLLAAAAAMLVTTPVVAVVGALLSSKPTCSDCIQTPCFLYAHHLPGVVYPLGEALHCDGARSVTTVLVEVEVTR